MLPMLCRALGCSAAFSAAASGPFFGADGFRFISPENVSPHGQKAFFSLILHPFVPAADNFTEGAAQHDPADEAERNTYGAQQ